MNNLGTARLRTCIVMDFYDEFVPLIEELSSNEVSADLLIEGGIEYKSNNIEDEDEQIVYAEKVYKLLSEYYGVDVTSVHADGFDVPYAWVVYKE